MWHEARRQEKAIRTTMIDQAKRQERRKSFYDSVRRDPAEFMQLHGSQCRIHMDPSVAKAADEANCLRTWQGDSKTLIDRFDARVHLDMIDDSKNTAQKNAGGATNEMEESQFHYERYRILVVNEFQKVSETRFLRAIVEKEHWPGSKSERILSIVKKEADKKRKLADKKAAIGYSYDDSAPAQKGQSTGGKPKSAEASESDSSDDEESAEFEIKLDPEVMTPEQKRELCKIAVKYNIFHGDFAELLKADRKDHQNAVELKGIDLAKQALSQLQGESARRERALLKSKRSILVGKYVSTEGASATLLSFVARKDSEQKPEAADSSSSDEGGDSKPVVERTQYITSFGGDRNEHTPSRSGGVMGNGSPTAVGVDDDDQDEDVVQGPALPPPEYRRLLALRHRRSNSPDFGASKDVGKPGRDGSRTTRRRSRSRSRSRDRRRRRTRSRSGDRNRGTLSSRRRRSSRDSGNRRSRSRSYDRRRRRDSRRRHSRSRSRSKSSRRRSSRGRESGRRSKSSSRSNSTSSRSSSSRSSERCRKSTNGATTTHVDQPGQSTTGPAVRLSTPSNSGGRGSGRRTSSSDNSNGASSPMSIRSSMSESEKERREVENRRRRVRRTKRQIRSAAAAAGQRSNRDERQERHVEGPKNKTTGEETKDEKVSVAEKLRLQMQKALKKTLKSTKEEEELKQKEQERERSERDEEIRELASKQRYKELEKRREERERRHREYRDSSGSRYGRTKRRRSRTRSPSY